MDTNRTMPTFDDLFGHEPFKPAYVLIEDEPVSRAVGGGDYCFKHECSTLDKPCPHCPPGDDVYEG